MNTGWSRRPTRYVATLMLVLLAEGCGTGTDRHNISGGVTYCGQPLMYGQIHFDPDASRENRGPQGVGEIRNGRYQTNPGYGPVPGPHIVRITGWESGPEKGMLPPALVSDYEFRVNVPSAVGVLNFDIPVVKKKSGR